MENRRKKKRVSEISVTIIAIEKQSNQQMTEQKFKLELIKEFGSRVFFSEDDIKKISMLTCYENLSYCCGLEKKCPNRDLALELLNISQEEYQNKKEAFKLK